MMKETFCNEKSPLTTKIALVLKYKLTSIKQHLDGFIYCKLDGEQMKISKARYLMLENNILYTWGGHPCDI